MTQRILDTWQAASAEVESKMRDFLFQYEPMQELKIGDVKLIARFARTFAFDAFTRDHSS